MGNNAVRAQVSDALRESYYRRIYDAERNSNTGEGIYSVEPGIDRLAGELLAGDQQYLTAVINGTASFDGVYERYRHVKLMLALEDFYIAGIIQAEDIPHTIEGIKLLLPKLDRLANIMLAGDKRFLTEVMMGRAAFNDVYGMFRNAEKEAPSRPRSTPPGVFNIETPEGDIFVGTTAALRNPDGAFEKDLRRAIAVFHRSHETLRGLPRLSEFVRAIIGGRKSRDVVGEFALAGGLRVFVSPFLLAIFDRDTPYGRVNLGDEFIRAVGDITHGDDLEQVLQQFNVDLVHRAGYARNLIAGAVARAITESHEKMTLPQGVQREALVPTKTAEEAIRALLANPDTFVDDEMLAQIQRALKPVDEQMNIAHRAFSRLPMAPVTEGLMRNVLDGLNHALMEGSFILQAPPPSSFAESGNIPLLAARNESIVNLIHGGGLDVFFNLQKLFGYRGLRDGGNVRLEVSQHGRPPNAADAAFFSVLMLGIVGEVRKSAYHNLPVDVRANYDALRQVLSATFSHRDQPFRLSQPGHLQDHLEELVRLFGPKGTVVSPTRGEYGGIDAVTISREPPTDFDGGTTAESPMPDFGSAAPGPEESARETMPASMSMAVNATLPPSVGAETLVPSATMPCTGIAETNDTIPTLTGATTMPPSMGTDTLLPSIMATIPCTVFKAG
jgi:hypothetical protein